MVEVKRAYNQLASQRENRRVSRLLKEALKRIHQALILNPEFSPFGVVPIAEEGRRGDGETGVETTPKEKEPDGINIEDIEEENTSHSDEGDSHQRQAARNPGGEKTVTLRIATPNAGGEKAQVW